MIRKQIYDWGASDSSIRDISLYGWELAKKIGEENVFNFSIGSPSAPPPAIVHETVERLLRTMPPQTLHGYTPDAGIKEVREKVAAYLNDAFSMNYTAEHIYMTHGASSALAILCAALLSEGDSAVTLTPYFTEYKVYVEFAGATLREAPSRPDTFQPDLDTLSAAIDESTRVLILNSPNNPSGAVITRENIAAVAALLREREEAYGHPIYIIADEPYRELVFDGIEVPFIPHFYADTIYCYSFSKSLSLPGERMGYFAITPTCAEGETVLTAAYGAARALGYICMSSLFQYVAAECLGVTGDVSVYKTNRDLIYGALREMGFEMVYPDGAFYLFLKSPEPDARAFCLRAREENILLVPGEEFGAPGYARLAYCVSRETLERSLPAWERLAASYCLRGR